MASLAKESSLSSESSSAGPSSDLSHCVPRDWKFWCIIFSLAVSTLLTAIEFTSIGAALPTIARSLKGDQFIWIGSAYALGSTAPILGRQPILLLGILVFVLGSTICGAASSMSMLAAGRGIQGLGAGAITSLVQIILSDLVTFRERGAFSGLMALTWALGGGVGPAVGGILAQSGKWYALRWLFYLNLPICAFNAILIMLFLRLKTPLATVREKFGKMDIIGNILVIGSTVSVVIELTWGGVQYPWSSACVLSPLVIGLVGLGVFMIYGAYFCKPPIVPIMLRMNWVGASGYIQNFLMGVVLSTLSYWYAIFFEACKEKSPSGAGIDLFGLSYSISLIALSTGIMVKKTGKYLIPIYVGWILTILTIIGAGLLMTLRGDSSFSKAVDFRLVIGGEIGIVYVRVLLPILASIPVTQTAPAMALYVFSRNFGYIWGVTSGGAIIQNERKKKLPSSFLTKLPQRVDIAFEMRPIIPSLNQPLKDEVRNTFGAALKVAWQVVLGIAIAGIFCSIGMKQLELDTKLKRTGAGKFFGKVVAGRYNFP